MGRIQEAGRGEAMIIALITALVVIIICAGLYALVSELRENEQRELIKAQREYIRSLEHQINRMWERND